MRKLIIILPLLLSACCTPPGTQVRVPSLPPSLAKKAEPLKPASDTSMGAQVQDNITNIRAYNDKGQQVNDLIGFFECVQEAINNKKEPKCL